MTNLEGELRALDGRGLTTNGPISPMAFYDFNRYTIELLYGLIVDDLIRISTGYHFSLLEDQSLLEYGHDLFQMVSHVDQTWRSLLRGPGLHRSKKKIKLLLAGAKAEGFSALASLGRSPVPLKIFHLCQSHSRLGKLFQPIR